MHFFPKEREMIEGQDFLNEIAAPSTTFQYGLFYLKNNFRDRK
ncbi:MAG TPA: hypothetical protein VI914_07770 [Thermodesulfobacteriota bacterium]|nr:hypothetical protein [Thermodesulfobacteriota bacterium]